MRQPAGTATGSEYLSRRGSGGRDWEAAARPWLELSSYCDCVKWFLETGQNFGGLSSKRELIGG